MTDTLEILEEETVDENEAPASTQRKAGKRVRLLFDPTVDNFEGCSVDDLATVDSRGWASIHHAAHRGLVEPVSRIVAENKQLLELKTEDTRSTPILVAAATRNLAAVRRLVGLGARVDASDARNCGLVEIGVARRCADMLWYLAELEHDKLPVWKRFGKVLKSEFNEEAEQAAWCLEALTGNGIVETEASGDEEDDKEIDEMQNEIAGVKPHELIFVTDEGDKKKQKILNAILENGICPVAVTVLRSEISEQVKLHILRTLLNVLNCVEIRDQLVTSGCVSALTRLSGSENRDAVIRLSVKCLQFLSTSKSFADEAAKCNVFSVLVEAASRKGKGQTPAAVGVSVDVLRAISSIAEGGVRLQNLFATNPEGFADLVKLYEAQTSNRILIALSTSIALLCLSHSVNQRLFVDEGVLSPLVALTSVQNSDAVQLRAVAAVKNLLENNRYTQSRFLDLQLTGVLVRSSGRGRHLTVRERSGQVLWWSVAGFDLEERRRVSESIGTDLFVDFIASPSTELQLIGSEGLGALAGSPASILSTRDRIDAVSSLVGLLESAARSDVVVVGALRALRNLSVKVGLVPRMDVQEFLVRTYGLKAISKLCTAESSAPELVRAEAALTVACVVLGNPELRDVYQSGSNAAVYDCIERLLRSSDRMVVLQSGSALATLAFNGKASRTSISRQLRLRLQLLTPFLSADDEFFSCNAAFQAVVLSPIFVDEKPAVSRAEGIKALTDLLQSSTSDSTRCLAADCVARLGRTRAGVPEALVALSTTRFLCDMLTSRVEQVRGCASLALGYLSFNPSARRQILNRCRLNPALMHILTYYCAQGKLSADLKEAWKHYKRIGLPQITQAMLPPNVNFEVFTGVKRKSEIKSTPKQKQGAASSKTSEKATAEQ